MKSVVLEYNEPVKLIPLGDFHIGTETNLAKIKRFLDNNDGYVILLGDLLDNAIVSSVGNVYNQKMSPKDANDLLIEFLTPYKERILGITNGNHERRTYKATGFDILYNVANILGVPYSNSYLLFDINIASPKAHTSKHRFNYCVVCHHGFAGGRTAERSTRQNRQLHEIFENVDVIITAHTHQPTADVLSKYVYDRQNKVLRKHNVTAVTIASVSNDEYAKEKGLPPLAEAVHTIKLSNTERRVTVETTVL